MGQVQDIFHKDKSLYAFMSNAKWLTPQGALYKFNNMCRDKDSLANPSLDFLRKNPIR